MTATNGHANGATPDETKVDVLIIGAGPAGVMVRVILLPPAGLCSSPLCTGCGHALTIHSPRLDRPYRRQAEREPRQRYAFLAHGARHQKSDFAFLHTGQADGLNSRSMEVFEALGFVESIEKEGSRMVRRTGFLCTVPPTELTLEKKE